MRLYIIVEGFRTEPRVLRGWLPSLVPGIREVDRPEDLSDGARCFYLISGKGYPSYFQRITAAAQDLRDLPLEADWLLIFADAEDITAAEREAEITAACREAGVPIPVAVHIADCCIESWLLGNRRLLPPQPQSADLQKFYAHYDARLRCPEAMPAHPGWRTRAQLCCDYLRAAFQEKGPHLHYSKEHPGMAAQPDYLDALRSRIVETGHLPSFARFLRFFDNFQQRQERSP